MEVGTTNRPSVKVTRMVCRDEPLINGCRITVLVEDTLGLKPNLFSKHGLSLLIEATHRGSKSKILYDTGPSSEEALRNAGILGLKLDDIDAIVLSHGHYDHTGGLLEVLKHVNEQIPVITHPKTFDQKFAYKPTLTSIGSRFESSSIEADKAALLRTVDPVTLVEGITTSGEIPLKTGFERPRGFWTVQDGRFVEDLLIDEQALIIDFKDRGIVVITGCAHRGVANTVRQAQAVTGRDKVHAIIGGFHLSSAGDDVIDATMRELKGFAPESIYTCHCTGKKAVKMLGEMTGSRCGAVHTGDSIILK